MPFSNTLNAPINANELFTHEQIWTKLLRVQKKIELRKLLSYYLDCLEDEDLRGLNFNLSQANQSFVLGENGSFLFNKSELQFTPAVDCHFWKNRESTHIEAEKLYIGYPVIIHKKTISPLYFLEVEVKPIKDGIFSLAISDNTCYLNHHLFGNKANDLEESLNLQQELECELHLLQENLTKALMYLDVQLENDHILINQQTLDSFKDETRWVKNYILFRGGRSAVNAMLRKDISTFLKYPKFIENIKGTALEAILNNNIIEKPIEITKPKFSELNTDQENAINAGLSQTLTVITGPPGTGKSQVVANILATCALNRKSALFASKNNKAVDVVYEKLQHMLENENWVLRLGNSEKIEQCQDQILLHLGTESEHEPHHNNINEKIFESEQKIIEISQIKAKLQNQQTDLNNIEYEIRKLENDLQPTWASFSNNKIAWNKNDAQIKNKIDHLHEQLLGISGKKSSYLILRFIAYFFSNHIKRRYLNYIESIAATYLNNTEQLLSLLRQECSFSNLCTAYENFSKLLRFKFYTYEKDRIEKLLLELPTASELKSLENSESERQIKLYQQKLRFSWGVQISQEKPRLFALCRRYFNNVKNPPNNHFGWKMFTEDFLNITNYFYVWIVTNLSARKSIPLEAKAFDIVVIDEASQCDILSALPLLFRAKNAIIIGDPKQLKHICTISAKNEKEIAIKHGVEELLYNWSYRTKSIYDLAESKLLESNIQPELLSFHYRCHPEIIGFSNNALYENKLNEKTNITLLKDKFLNSELGVFWHDIKGVVPPSTNSAYNLEEINYIIELIEKWRPNLESKKVSIGIISPFRKQVDKIKSAIEAKHWDEDFMSSIVIGTAHRFQGDECDIIIFSPVIGHGIRPYLANWVATTKELLNVAVTRARGAFHVVGDKDSCKEAGFLLNELAVYIENCRHPTGTHLTYESPAEEIVGETLNSLGLHFITQVEKGAYRLDFIVTSPFGNKINIEVDGRQHYTPEHITKDEIRDRYISSLGYKIIRINAKDTFTRPNSLKRKLSQLI